MTPEFNKTRRKEGVCRINNRMTKIPVSTPAMNLNIQIIPRVRESIRSGGEAACWPDWSERWDESKRIAYPYNPIMPYRSELRPRRRKPALQEKSSCIKIGSWIPRWEKSMVNVVSMAQRQLVYIGRGQRRRRPIARDRCKRGQKRT